LVNSRARNIPKKKEAKRLTKEVLFIENPNLVLQVLCNKILNVNPKKLPLKTQSIELKCKI